MQDVVRRLSHNEIFVAALGIILLGVLFLLKDVIMLLFIAFILVIALHPFIHRLVRYKVPPALATLLIVLAGGGILGGLFFLIYHGLSRQIDELSLSLSSAINSLPFTDTFRVNISLNQILDQFFAGGTQIFATVTYTIVSLIAGFVTILVISIYWLSDYEKVRTFIVSRFKNRERASRMYDAVERRLGGWVRGQLLISLVIGILSYIAYLLIGLPAARALAIIAALFEIIPTLGPILAAIPAILIALTVSPQVALLTLLANLGIQQLENNLIAPKILQRTARLHPIAIIIVLYAGSQLAGLMGVLLAVPVTLLIASLHEGYTDKAPKSSVI